MVRVRWVLVLLGAAAVALTFLASGDITTRLTAAMAYGFGLVILGTSERIIVSTRTRPETRLAAARQGTIKR
jgi:glycerol uptake facilitator-like aquaporin